MSSSESHSALVLELAEEFLERYRQGQRPSLKEYADRHPDLAAEIREVFPAMALMENIALADESLAGGETPPGGGSPPEVLQQLGDFRIIREVGHGGMGVVYEAEQVSLGRHVALKVLTRKMLLEARQRRRFEREAKAAAKLHHTNIVPVFGVGEQDGLPYYVMQFIQGLGLDEVLDELKRMQGGTPAATASAGDLRVARKDVSAVEVARSLMTGEFHPAEEPDEPSEPLATGPTAPESGAKLSGSFTLSSSSLTLPGAGSAARGKAKKLSYWQSVAGVGVQVAEALAYAHNQGILHRDIKPSNLLLDTAGTVWVADFGLARAQEEEGLTHTGDIVGTLRYMPPEAFEGRADARGDLYSLGLTLYELLALRPAFEEKDRQQLIKRVTTEEPPRLDRLNPQVPRDLVTIVHKAIDREPEQRYPSAAALAADLQRFLDDEPIKARRVSARERLWRWCRHHPGVASLTAALVLVLVGVTLASVLAAARFDRLARQQAAAAADERQARQAADEAKEHEAALRQQAEEAQKQAEANFAQARKAVDDSFTKVSESQLLKVPGMQPLRRDLLQSALTFYQDFLKERGDDPALRGDLAAAYLRVGKIRSELGEGAEAHKAFEQARGLYEALTRAAPEAVEWRHGLAQCYYSLGRNDDAIALWEKLVQPDQPRFQKELADACNARANHFNDANRLAEALQGHQQALAIREMLVRLSPDDPDAQRDLGGTLNNIGVLLDRKGRTEEALAMFRRATEHGEAAFAQAPQVLLNGRYLTIQQGNVARIERQLGHVNEALAAYRRVVDVCRKLARDNPAIPNLQSNLNLAYRMLAFYQRELKQSEQAEQTMRLARDVIDRLPSDGAENLFYLACVWAECSSFLAQGKDKPTAEEQAEQKQQADLAMEALRKAVAAGFRDVERLRTASELNALRGREDFKAVEADLAARVAAVPDKLEKSQQALALRQQRAAADPKNQHLQADLAASQHAIALIQLDLGNLEEARQHLQRAIVIREALVKGEPKNEQYQADLAQSRIALGDFYWKAGRLAEGAKEWQRVLDAVEASARQGQDRPSLAGQLLTTRRTVAQRYARAGLWSEAAAQYGRLIQGEGATADDYGDAACLALRAGDAAAYRRVCTAMVQRFGASEGHPQDHMLAWTCSLADHAGSAPSRFLDWKSDATNTALLAWWSHVLALAHYRAGQFAEAIAQADQSNTLDPDWSSNMVNGPVLAMAHYRLGHAAESRKWLDQSIAAWRRLSPLMHSADSPTVLPSASEYWSTYWHDWTAFEVLLREASVLITGAPPVGEAYDHAHQGLLYSRLGEAGKAQAQWQAAVQIAPQEPALWLARAHAFAQLGQREKADADFAQAAVRTPEELNRFIQAGWWVIGPYPEDLKAPCPPEKDPDPSRPVVAFGTAAELRWRPAPPEPDGRVDLRAVFNADHISAYALTYVYSPDERTATLMVGGDDKVRVWLNGRLVHETNRLRDWAWDLDPVPVTFKAGRNILLCKISQELGPHYLYLRVADYPFDRAMLHASLGLWDEAAAEFARGLDRQPFAAPEVYRSCAQAQLVAGDTAGYRRCLGRMFERYGQDGNASFELAYAGALRDGAAEATRLANLAEHALEGDKSPWVFHVAGIAHYRAGQFEQAIGRFEESLKDPAWQAGGGHASEVGLALAHHRLGHAKAARQWFDKAEQWYGKAVQDALASPTGRATLFKWWDWPSFVVLRREAHKLILGTDLKDDPRLEQLADRMRDWLRKRDKATADYDVALFLEPNEPRLWLARGRRFVELKRDREAAADFAQALGVLPEDGEVMRREIFADLDRGDQLLNQVVALRRKDDKLAAFLRARTSNARDSGPAGIVLAGNLLRNGSFEEGTEAPGYKIYPTGSTEVPGWTVSRGSVDVGGLPWFLASHGSRCLDLDGAQPGAIRQTVPTKSGQRYRLVFDLAGNPYYPAGLPAVKRLRVQAAGQSAVFAFDTTGRSAAAPGWVCKQW